MGLLRRFSSRTLQSNSLRNFRGRTRGPLANGLRSRLTAETLEPRLALAVTAVADAYVTSEDIGFATGMTAVVPRRSAGGWAVFDDIPSTGQNSTRYPDTTQSQGWFARGYNTASPSFGAWESSAGLAAPFAYDIVNVLEPATQIEAPARYVNTVLARKTFALSAAQAAATSMTLDFVCDDGCVFYLNDREVHRVNLPTGPVTPATFATASGLETAYTSVTLNLASLGVVLFADTTNVLAVEVHNGDPASSDLGFDASLSVAGGQSGTRTNDNLASATVPVNTFYWDGIANPATTTATSGPVFAADGTMQVGTMQVGTVTIDAATGDFRYAPVLAGLGVGYNGLATFRYVIRDSGISATASTATATITISPTNDAPIANVDVYSITTQSGALSVGAAVGATYIQPGSSWHFSDTLVDQDGLNPAWRGPPSAGFNPASGTNAGWSAAPATAPLGFGDGGMATTLAAEAVTYYFFRRFDVVGTLPSMLRLGLRADDCAVVYINGAEVTRSPSLQLGQGIITFCNSDVDGLAELAFREVAIPTAGLNLQATGNTIAVEVHQAATEDLAFDLWLRNGNSGLIANDLDPDDLSSELVAEVVDQSQFTAAVGTLVVQSNGSFTFTPAAQVAPGSYTFTYRVRDNGSPIGPALESRLATVTINVLADARDRPPIAMPDEYEMLEDQTLTVSRALPLVGFGDEWSYFDEIQNGRQANPNVAAESYPVDSSADNDATPGASDPWYSESFNTASSNPAIGTWKTGRGIFAGPIRGMVYGPGATLLGGIGNAASPAGENTVDTYLFRKTFNVDDAANITSLFFEMLFDDGFVLYVNGVDIGGASMPTGVITTTTLANAGGSEDEYLTFVLQNASGLLRNGLNTIAVEIHQNSRTSSDVGFDLSLAAAPDAGVLTNDRDPNGNALGQVRIVRPPANGTVAMSADGSFVYTPNANYSGEDEFDYVVRANGIDSAPATVEIEIESVDEPPDAVADIYATRNNQTLTRTAATGVLANDVGEGALVVRVDLSGGATINHAAGTFTWNGVTGSQSDGSFTFVPAAGFAGQFVLTYIVQDSAGRQDTANLTIDVTLATLPDDLNGDGNINRADLAIIVGNLGLAGATLAQGDMNGDGKVTLRDAVLMRNAMSPGSSPVAPSPAAITATRSRTNEVDAVMRRVASRPRLLLGERSSANERRTLLLSGMGLTLPVATDDAVAREPMRAARTGKSTGVVRGR
jgi:hypothetical protein